MNTVALPADRAFSQYRLAILCVIMSSTINSGGGLLFRSLETANEWQVIFFRALGLALSLSIVFTLQQRRDLVPSLLRIGLWGVLGSVAIANASVCFIISLSHTTVANTLFILSAVPFFTAILARIFLGERVRRITWIAMAVSLVGICIMLGDGFSAGNLFGNVMALVCALSFASFVVILRRGRNTNMLPAVILGALLSALTGAFMSGFQFAIPASEIATCLLWGGVLSCAAHTLFTFGSRHVEGAELTLIVLLEFILGPIWVWLIISEQPSNLTLLGGSLVLVAVASRGLAGIRPKRKIPSP